MVNNTKRKPGRSEVEEVIVVFQKLIFYFSDDMMWLVLNFQSLSQRQTSMKVLLVDDEHFIHDLLDRFLQPQRIVVLHAKKLQAGQDLYDQNKDVDLIVMNGCIESSDIDTIPLVRHMRQTYQGPMLASSGVPYFNDQLLQAGCSHKTDDPGDLLPKIRMILDLP